MAVDAVIVQIVLPDGHEPVPYRTYGRQGGLPPYLPAKGDTVVWDGHRYLVHENQYLFHEDRLMGILVRLAEGEPPTRGGSATDLATVTKIA